MIIAVDTGGTKTLIECFDVEGKKQHIAKFPTPRHVDEYVDQVVDAIRESVEPQRIEALVIAVPGPLRDNILLNATNIGWKQLDIVSLLTPHFPTATILIGNDADLAGLGEARMASPIPAVNLYITLSTGIGTGLAVNGTLLPGLSYFEGGRMQLEYAGKTQHWEDFASGRNFYERYQQYGSDVDDEDKWRDYALRVAVGLQVLLPLLSPDSVVIGGSMGVHFAKYERLLHEALQATLSERLIARATIRQAKHPEEAVIYGCYYYAVDQLAG